MIPKVKKNLNFIQGDNPYKSLSIGQHKPFVLGDKIQLNINIGENPDNYELIIDQNVLNNRDDLIIYGKNDILTLKVSYTKREYFHKLGFNKILHRTWVEDHPEIYTRVTNESLGFQQGINPEPYKTLSIGENRQFRDGDKIVLTEHVWWFDNSNANWDIGNWYDTNNINVAPGTDSLIFNSGSVLIYDTDDDEFQNNNHEYIPYKWLQSNKHVWKRYINESLEFQQKQDPYKTLDVGPNRPSSWPRSFEDLDDQQKGLAIEYVRNTRTIEDTIIDNDFLLEPPHKDIIALFGTDFYEEKMYNKPIIGNDFEKLYYNIHYPQSINLKDAVQINNDYYFKLWLGIPEEIHNNIYYTIGENTIEFEENDSEYTFSEDEDNILTDARHIFERHCVNVLDIIKDGFDYLTSDETIEEDIIDNDWKFNEDGNMVNESINEFEKGGNPYNALGVGNRVALEKWMEENLSNMDYTINKKGELDLNWFDIQSNTLIGLPPWANINLEPHIDKRGFSKLSLKRIMAYTDLDKLKVGSDYKMIIQLFYLRDVIQNQSSEEIEDFLVDMYEEFGEQFMDKSILSKVLDKSDAQRVIILSKKLKRDERQTMEDEHFNTYVFISYEDFKEVTIEGEDYHKKILGIENLFKIDIYDSGSLSNVSGMKMRAMTAHHGHTPGGVYAVKIPKYMAEKDNYYNEEISDDLRKYVDEKKYKI